jgi:ribosomal protein S27E
MQHLDGNALAGQLADYFSFEVTAATVRCNGCGSISELARAMVYRSRAGTVVRCASCDQVLATVVEAGDRAWIGFSGVSAIEVPRSRPTSA